MRDAAKSFFRGLALLVVLPALISFWVRRTLMGRDRALEGSTQALSIVPGVLGQYLRRAFLSQTIAHCASSATICFGTLFSKCDARIDDYVYIGPGCSLGLVHIERDVLIGSGVHITSGNQTHGTSDSQKPMREQEGFVTLVRIGAGAWIGSAAIVMADVGANSVVGAGAVVTAAVPMNVVAVGVPARVVRGPFVRVLFITHRLPYAPNRGDRIRAYHLLREMSKWAEVHLCALVHDDEEASHAEDLRSTVRSVTIGRVPRLRNLIRGGLALGSSTPLTHLLLDTPQLAATIDQLALDCRPDVVYCYCTGVGPLALRPSLTGIPLVLDMVDVDSIKWSTLARSSSYPMSWVYSREARCLSRFESDIAMRAVVTLLVTEAERRDLEKIAPAARAVVVEAGVDSEHYRPDPQRRIPSNPTVVFCGVMNYPPNVQGIRWFASNVWPIVRTRLPGAELKIVGANPSGAVLRLEDSLNGIQVTGTVPDVRPFLWAASAAIAPLMTARGVQTKVLEAIAAGLTAVVTPAVSKGLPPDFAQFFKVAETPQEFAEAVVVEATTRRQECPPELLRAMSWESRLGQLKTLLESARRNG